MAMREQERDLAEMDAVYDRYVQPLEAEHMGRFVAVTPDGRTLLGESVSDVTDKVLEAVGRGSRSHVFKIGPRIVGKWR